MPVVPPYSYCVFWSPEDKEFVATCVEIPGLSGLAPTEAGAIEELKVAIGGWLEHLSEQGTPWPEPPSAPPSRLALLHPRRSEGTCGVATVPLLLPRSLRLTLALQREIALALVETRTDPCRAGRDVGTETGHVIPARGSQQPGFLSRGTASARPQRKRALHERLAASPAPGRFHGAGSFASRAHLELPPAGPRSIEGTRKHGSSRRAIRRRLAHAAEELGATFHTLVRDAVCIVHCFWHPRGD